MYFVLYKMSYFSVPGSGPLLTFACITSYYAYEMTKCTENVPEVKIQDQGSDCISS